MKIKELQLYTAQLETQTTFYTEVLGLEIIAQTKSTISFQIGNALLEFSYRAEFTPYHYAINIPANKEQEALEWLKKRVAILKYEGNEIQYFDFWNAYAIYFYDADHNIVEFIARKNLKNNATEAFNVSSLLGISEIGLPTFDINQEYQLLNKKTGIEIHSGNLERFCALGDENGLFIMINKNEKKEWYPTLDKPYSSDFKIIFMEKGEEYKFVYKGEKLAYSK